MCPVCDDRGCPTCTSPPPPGHTYGTWAVLLRRLRQMDDRANYGAGKPRLTSGNGGEHTYESATMGTENRVLPAPLPTARELADPTKESRHA